MTQMHHQPGFFILSSGGHRSFRTAVTTDLTASARQALENAQTIVYFEEFVDVFNAIYRERCIRGWRRQTQIALIERMNPTWADLCDAVVEGRVRWGQAGTPAHPRPLATAPA